MVTRGPGWLVRWRGRVIPLRTDRGRGRCTCWRSTASSLFSTAAYSPRPPAESRELNLRHPCDPKKIHAVVVSHAHIDHTGRLPMLIRDGFMGGIHTTPATRDLCAIMLADAAHIQEEDARFLNKRRRGRGD